MNTLKLETFLSSDTDWEKNQYAVLGGLKEYRTNFYRKQLYPALSELISLFNILEDVLNHKKSMSDSFPKEITEYDIKNKKIIYQALERLSPDVEFLFELIEWSLPKIKEVIEEGAVLFEYVEKNLKVEQVGIIPLYKSEGYFIVPDNSESVFKVMRFECSMFYTGKEPFRALKTRIIESIEMSRLMDNPESIKLDLARKYRDLPNPATYLCVTELDFPFSETLFPVAKRKLLSSVAVS
jgi:hypothetical protein